MTRLRAFQLVTKGWRAMSRIPRDRRSSLVRLTPRDCKLIDAALEDHFAAEADIVAELDSADTDQCVELLRLLARRVRRWTVTRC